MLYCYRSLAFLFLIVGIMLVSTFAHGASKQAHRPALAPPTLIATKPAPPPSVPSLFAAGERLTFTAFFNALPAGEGEILLRRAQQEDGQETFHFTGRARTHEWLDTLYKRRDTAEAIFGLRDYSPNSFRFFSREGSRRREYAVRYDAATQTLLGSATKRKQVREQSLTATNVYDPVSALYLLRSRALIPGTPIQVDLFTGKGRYRFIVRVITQEAVIMNDREHWAFRLHPQLFSLEKDLAKNILPENTTLWVSADALHTPLKLESVTKWGWITVELTKH